MKPTTTLSREHIPVTASTAHQPGELSSPFTWAKVHARMMQLKKRLPEPWDELLPVSSVNDTKIIARLLLAVSVPLLGLGLCAIPIVIALYVHSLFSSKRKGGAR